MIWEGGAKHDVYEYLIHSGIRGQKWGVRRFQNKDGTWTAEGKKRRAVKEGYSDKPNKKSKNETKKEKIEISKMSDDELRSRINRMQLEEQYKQYLAKANPKKKSKVKEVMSKLVENAAMTVGNKAVESIANKMFAKSKPKKKPIDLDSLTPEKLKKMNKEELDEVNAYADALKKAEGVFQKSEKIKITMKERMSDISNVAAYQNAGAAYFNALSSDKASNDDNAYYKWLEDHSTPEQAYFSRLNSVSSTNDEKAYYAWLGKNAMSD